VTLSGRWTRKNSTMKFFRQEVKHIESFPLVFTLTLGNNAASLILTDEEKSWKMGPLFLPLTSSNYSSLPALP
jgi:hypothetical protein